MKLSIYVGVRSIGWNITHQNQIIAHGIKRVNIDFDSYYAYLAGVPVPKRIDRRIKRSARRNLWRRKSRRQRLLKLLKSKNMLPTDEMMTFSRQELNTLRHKACLEDEYIHPALVGRVLLDLHSKRGYKSMRGVDDTGDSDYLAEIAEHEENRKKYPTVGAYLNSLPTNKNVILRRETYEQELRDICKAQQLDVNDFHGTLFFQRPLKKGKIAFCKYEKNRKVTHASNPLYQLFRIARDVKNITIYDLENNEVEINNFERNQMEQLLWSGKDLTKAGALKIMGLKKPANYKWYSGKSIAGNIWGKIFGQEVIDYNYNFLSDIWQDLISATDNDVLINLLIKKYKFSEEKATQIADYDIRSLGYADYSHKAILKLYSNLWKYDTLSQVVLEVYGKVDFGTDLHLRNVVLEQVFFSTQSLVKALQKKYEIMEIVIEIDRLLKMGNKARKELARANRRREKDIEELNAQIRGYGVLNDYNRQKMRLWNESEGYSPYEPERKIPLEELFTDKYNLDHIVPKSKIFDFSNDNLVLAPKHLNEAKNRMTGQDFAESLGIRENYIEFVNSRKFSDRKKQFLLMSEDDIPTDWLSRSAGTDYNTRCFLTLAPGAYCIPNKLVNMYLRQWHWDAYDEDDVRNSLAKSYVLANFDKATLDYFDNIKYLSNDGISISFEKLPFPLRGKSDGSFVSAYSIEPNIIMPYLKNVRVYVPRVKFFRKTKHGHTTRFALHKETVYGERKRYRRNAKGEIITDLYYQVRQPISKMSNNMLKNISDKAIQRILLKDVEKYGSIADAVQAWNETPPKFNGKPIRSVAVAFKSSSLTPLHSAYKGETAKFSKYSRKVDFVYNSMMYSVKIEDGKRVTKPLIQALRELNEGTFTDKDSFHKGDKVAYEGNPYFISGIEESGAISLRSVYTLKAENALKLTKVEDILKLERIKEGQV